MRFFLLGLLEVLVITLKAQHKTYSVGAISAAHPLAVEAGVEMLRRGGNAIDAAVAVHFALAAVYQVAGNIAGGGFAVVHIPEGQVLALDFRETAPMAATADMYLDSNGKPIKRASLDGAPSVGIPGTVAGMKMLHDSLGCVSWQECLQPAIELAKGHKLTKYMADHWNNNAKEMLRINGQLPSFLNLYVPFKEGDWLVQTELAETLESIAVFGSDSFYLGTFAQQMAEFLKSKGGRHTHEDFALYRALWRKPQLISYRGYSIYTMPLPSAGGIGLHQFLKMAELLCFNRVKPYTVKYAHFFAEMAKRVYADRQRYLGDPMAVDQIEIQKIQSEKYLKSRAASISKRRITPSDELGASQSGKIESFQTTHYCTADSSGLIVSITTTLNGYFGSKLYYKGMFFNNEMDDFSTAPGHSNQFGLPYSEVNKVRPGHRMLSSMSPTIVVKDGKPIAALGTPGGSTIITNVFQVIELMIRGWGLQSAIDQKKLHAQWLPEDLIVEKGALTPKKLRKLSRMGYNVQEIEQIGIFNGIEIQDKKMIPAADFHRKGNSAAGGL
ncbi:gamma-glutamyltransferase [Thermaurantimonas aggregans]|nr:gamma-glutamyltransferase [Thermaurantimonas aggregans]MCX8147985.1 gamma-glutamyltransferase [Thermaurantimonas aggregans]